MASRSNKKKRITKKAKKNMVTKDAAVGVPVPYGTSSTPAGSSGYNTPSSNIVSTPPPTNTGMNWPAPSQWYNMGKEATKKAILEYTNNATQLQQEQDNTQRLELTGKLNLAVQTIIQGLAIATEAAEAQKQRIRTGDQSATYEIALTADTITRLLKILWAHNYVAKKGTFPGVEIKMMESQLTGRINRIFDGDNNTPVIKTNDDGLPIELDKGEDPNLLWQMDYTPPPPAQEGQSAPTMAPPMGAQQGPPQAPPMGGTPMPNEGQPPAATPAPPPPTGAEQQMTPTAGAGQPMAPPPPPAGGQQPMPPPQPAPEVAPPPQQPTPTPQGGAPVQEGQMPPEAQQAMGEAIQEPSPEQMQTQQGGDMTAQREQEVAKREQEVAKREAQLAQREAQLAQREAVLSDTDESDDEDYDNQEYMDDEGYDDTEEPMEEGEYETEEEPGQEVDYEGESEEEIPEETEGDIPEEAGALGEQPEAPIEEPEVAPEEAEAPENEQELLLEPTGDQEAEAPVEPEPEPSNEGLEGESEDSEIHYCVECDREVDLEDIETCENPDCPLKHLLTQEPPTATPTEAEDVSKHYLSLTYDDHEGHNIHKIKMKEYTGVEGDFCSHCHTIVGYEFDCKEWSIDDAKGWVRKQAAINEIKSKSPEEMVFETLDKIPDDLIADFVAEKQAQLAIGTKSYDLDLKEAELKDLVSKTFRSAFSPLDDGLNQLGSGRPYKN